MNSRLSLSYPPTDDIEVLRSEAYRLPLVELAARVSIYEENQRGVDNLGFFRYLKELFLPSSPRILNVRLSDSKLEYTVARKVLNERLKNKAK